MGLSQRNKGRRGETEAKRMLTDRDWTIDADLTAGVHSGDLLATSPEGVTYMIEVKNQAHSAWLKFLEQARLQAKEVKRPWMLMVKIASYSSYVVFRQGEQPVVWSSKGVNNGN